MSLTTRVYPLLESELNKCLSFSYSIVAEQNGAASRRIRPDQPFVVEVWARNDAPLTLMNVRGAVHPTSIARFEVARFQLPELRPRDSVMVARFQARIVEAPPGGNALDQIATINVSGQPDLSNFWFRDQGRALSYAQTASRRSNKAAVRQPFAGQETSKVHALHPRSQDAPRRPRSTWTQAIGLTRLRSANSET